MTNLDNLVPLCVYHNGLNQDDPAGPAHRGRIGRVGGYWPGYRPSQASRCLSNKTCGRRLKTRPPHAQKALGKILAPTSRACG